MGARLHALRRARRLTRNEVMALSGVHYDLLRRIEKGERDIELSVLFALCGVYDADASRVIQSEYSIPVA
jgi:transcriptional regulator with XRE-family HTH domain